LLEWSPSAKDSEGRSPEETPRSALSLFSSEAIIRKGRGALFDFGNISRGFGQAEGEVAKSMSSLGKRHKEETRIEMDELKEEIRNIKDKEDKMIRLVQDLLEQRKGSDTGSEEGKPRSTAKEEDWFEDEIRNAVRKGLEPC